MKSVKLAILVIALLALTFISYPASAANTACAVSPSDSAPIGTTFWITCTGLTPLVYANVYVVEPDGRASGVNLYGLFPTSVKADADGVVNVYFVTSYPGFYSVGVGKYTFVIQELGLGNTLKYKQEVGITVESKAVDNSTAELTATGDGRYFTFYGRFFDPNEYANVWVTAPDTTKCSGFGFDQATLGTLPGDGSSVYSGPGTVQADAYGEITFPMVFFPRACIGEYIVTVATPDKHHAAEASIRVSGYAVTETGGASVWVSPDKVTVYNSFFSVYGSGFPANSTVNCWFTRPDGRVLEFINRDAKTDSSGSFSTGAFLDDFPPYTSSEPGQWYVTCATPNRSDLAVGSFWAYAPALDP